MRHRNGTRAGRLVESAGLFSLEQLEQRRLLSSDLAGIQLVLNAAGDAAEVRQWTGEHERDNGGGTADAVTFRLSASEERSVGEDDFVGPVTNDWREFAFETDGELAVTYTTGSTTHTGSSFDNTDGFGLGWLIEGDDGQEQSISILHELTDSASIPALNGSWYFATIVLPTSGSAQSSTVSGAYGSVTITDLTGNYNYTANLIDSTETGSGQIESLAEFGLGQIADSEYFAVSADGNFMTAVDLSYADGLTYLTVAMRRGEIMTTEEIAGEYRFGAALSGSAAAVRGDDLLEHESVYLKMNLDGTAVAYDLADWDNGIETVVHTGVWNLLPEGRTVLLTYEDIDEAHLIAFGADRETFLDFRVNHGSNASDVLGVGHRVDDGDGSVGEQDDHADDGEYDNATDITLSTNGSGNASGEIETATDSDLFAMNATVTGIVTITLSTSGGDLAGEITLKNTAGEVLDSAAAEQDALSVSLTWEVTQGSDYYIVVAADGQESTGIYSLAISTEDTGGVDEDYVDDYGADDDGDGDELADPADVPFPHFILPGRATSGKQAVWEYGRDGTWYYSKLSLRYDTADIIGEIVTWEDEATDAYMVAAATADGMLLWVRDENTGLYELRNLTEEAGDDADIPVSPATYVRLDDGRNVLTALNADGDVIAYVESQGSTFMVNLTVDEIRADGDTLPALTGTLAAGVSDWGTTIIAGLDADGMVWTVWFSLQGQNGWEASPLSAIADADPLTGNLSLYFTSWKGINVAGLNDDGQTEVLWWVPKFGGNWEVSNLTELFDGPEYKPGTMTTYTTPWNALTVVGITTQGAMVAYWWAPGFSRWEIADFSEVLPTRNPRVIRGPVYAEVRANKNIWLIGRDTDNQMVRAVWSFSEDRWTSSILNTSAQQF